MENLEEFLVPLSRKELDVVYNALAFRLWYLKHCRMTVPGELYDAIAVVISQLTKVLDKDYVPAPFNNSDS